MHDQLKKDIVQVDVFLPFLAMVFSWSTCKLYKVWDLSWWEKMRAVVMPSLYCQWWGRPTC